MQHRKTIIGEEIHLEEGLELSHKGNSATYKGHPLTMAPGAKLFVQQASNLQCICCGINAVKWKLTGNGNRPPFLDLYGVNTSGRDVLFTRDHIIPKVFGGNDDITNFRIMCEFCNGERGCEMDEFSLKFYSENINRNILIPRIQDTITKLTNGIKNKTYQPKDAQIIIDNFTLIFEHLKEEKKMSATFQGFYRQVLLLKPMAERNAAEVETKQQT